MPTSLEEVSNHICQIHVIDLLGNLRIPFIPWGFQVDVQVAND